MLANVKLGSEGGHLECGGGVKRRRRFRMRRRRAAGPGAQASSLCGRQASRLPRSRTTGKMPVVRTAGTAVLRPAAALRALPKRRRRCALPPHSKTPRARRWNSARVSLHSRRVGKIPEETIEQIAAANDIVEVIGGYFPLKRAGGTFKALCPFHHEKTPSFTVNPHRQMFKCFGCGKGGSVFRFVMDYENVDFPTAARRLAERAGIKIVEEQLSAEDEKRHTMRQRLLALHQQAAEWFHRNLLKSADAQPARDYLKKRGLTREVAASWKIGYAPDSWDACGNWAREQGFSAEELIASGLVKVKDTDDATAISPKSAAEPGETGRQTFSESKRPIRNPQFYDRFRNRVMFPICNDIGAGEVIAFSGRVLSADAKEAKYVNSPETILFTKGNVLFGLHKSKRALIDKSAAIVCEGQIDLITAFEAGVQNVIAPQGTAFTEKQARVLKRYVEEVILCFDADMAGQKATERSLAILLEADLNVRVAEMPEGDDPDSLIRGRGAEAFVAVVDAAKDFFDFQIERESHSPEFATPRGKMQFAKKMAGFVGLLGNPVLRESVVNKVCSRLEISPNDFRPMLGSQRPQQQRGDGVAPSEDAGETPAARSTPVKLNNTLTLLCQLALRHAPSREWLRAQAWRELLAREADAEILAKILEADLRPDDASSINTFTAGLSEAEESLISTLLMDKLPTNPDETLRDCWRTLESASIRRRKEALANRLKTPNLSFDEIIAIQKEIKGLQTSEEAASGRDRRPVERNT
jgi:DNA primase